MRKRKIVAVMLTAVMTMGMTAFAGCSKKDDDEVAGDDQWYDVIRTSAADFYDTVGFPYDSMWSEIIGSTDDHVVVLTNLYRDAGPEDVGSDSSDREFSRVYLDLYSTEVGYEQSILLDDYLSDIDGYYYVESAEVDGDTVNAKIYSYKMSSNGMDIAEDTYYELPINIVTGEVSELKEIGGGGDFSDEWETMSDRFQDGTFEGSWIVGDYTIYRYYLWDGNKSSYIFIIEDASGKETTIDLRNIVPDYSIYDISNYVQIDDNSLLLITSSEDSNVHLLLDLSNLTISDVSEEYAWLEDDLYNVKYIDGKGLFYVDTDYSTYHCVLKKLDFDAQETVEVIDFSNSNINPMDMWNMELVSVEDDGFVMAGAISGGAYGSDRFCLFIFREAETNPNVGKTILKAASLSGYNYAIFESICQFNEASDQYFIKIDDRYNIDSNLNWDDYSEDTDWTSTYLSQAASLGDQLTVDLMAGDGPDILFNAYSLPQLNNSRYLVDLSDRVGDQNKYFTNIFDGVSVNRAIYQVPMVFTCDGIATYSEFVEDGQEGFTFDQYERFVDQVCNGDDPLASDYMSQLDYFVACYNAVSDLFESGNGVNYDCDAFRDLAEYVKNNVNDAPASDDSDMAYYSEMNYMGNDSDTGEKPNATGASLGSIYDFLYNYGKRAADVRFLGYPSEDSRGPMFRVQLSVAISASSKNLDGCYQFIDLFLGEEMQRAAAKDMWGLPVNISVFDEMAQMELEQHNDSAAIYHLYLTDAEIRQYGLDTTILDESVIDYLKSVIMNCKKAYIEDPYVSVIIREEMQPYFAGQKSLDTVIDTLTNRVTTYLTERG